MSARKEAGCDWDMKGLVGNGTLHEVLGLGEEARGSTVAVSAIRDTRGSYGCRKEKVAAHGGFPFTESSKISTGGGVSVPELCLAMRAATTAVLTETTIS